MRGMGYDERFLRSFLKRDPATDLISFFILRNTSDLTMAGPDELALIPFPTDELAFVVISLVAD